LTGSSSTTGGSAGRGGGDGGSGTTTIVGSGGGGAALGGVAFVRSGGTLIINTDIPVGTLTAGISGTQNGSGTSRSGQAVGTSIFINGNTTLTFSKTSGTQTILGTIVDDQSLTQGTGTQGSGALAKSGNGTLVLSGVNTYTGGTTATAGIISIGADSGIGSVSGGLTLNGGTLELTASFATTRSITLGASGGTFQVDPGFLYTVNSSIGGAGNLTKTGTGVMLLGLSCAYGGSTNVNVGTLRMGTVNALPTTSATTVTGTLDLQTFNTAIGPLAGAGSVTATAATLTVNESTSSTFSGVIGSSLSLIKSGASTLTLSGANTYSGTTSISTGTMQIGASNTLPSLTVLTIDGTLDMNNNTNTVGQLSGSGTMALTTTGALTVSGGAASLFSGNITSSGGTLTNSGGGTLTLTGNNIGTFNGQLINNSPSILVGNSLSISNSVLNDGQFIFNQTVDGSYAGLINTLASGAMNKQGAASLNFTGTLAQHTVSVDSGVLRVNTVNFQMLGIGGLLTVQTGGTLGGTGTIIGNVTNFGTVNPGNSIGTLTIHGDYLQATGSSLIIELSPPTQADHLIVTGPVVIQSGATLALQPDFGTYPSEFIIEIVTGGSVTGTFSTVTTTLPSFSARVVYFPAEIDLILNVIPINVLQPKGNPNAVANCLEANASYADFTSILDQLHFMSLSQMRSTLEEMQPSLFKGLILTREQNTLDLMSALAARHTPETGCGGGKEYRYSFWAAPYFSHLSQGEEELEPSFDSLSGSAVAGIDFFAWSAPLVTSVAFGYTGSSVHWNQSAGSGSLANYYGALSVNGLADGYFFNASFVGGME
jgi:autotransporter-associated beta strand protein